MNGGKVKRHEEKSIGAVYGSDFDPTDDGVQYRNERAGHYSGKQDAEQYQGFVQQLDELQ